MYGACVGVEGQPQVSIFDFHLVIVCVCVVRIYLHYLAGELPGILPFSHPLIRMRGL